MPIALLISSKSFSMEGVGGLYGSPPIIENHRYLSVWKTVPSEARVTRDEVSGIMKVRESCLEDSTTIIN